MLRTGFSLILLSLCTTLCAQVQFAAFAGPQVSTVNYKVRGKAQPTDIRPSAMAGLGLKAAFENNLYFFPSIYYSMKTYHVVFNDRAYPPTELALNNKVRIHTIEIAPLFQVDFSKKPSHSFIRFGPAVDVALGGTEIFDTLSTSGSIHSFKRPMYFDYTSYGKFTASANLHLGYESSRGWMLFAHMAYGIGSRNNADHGPRILHRVYGITGGWYFGRAGF